MSQFYAPWCGHCQALKPAWEQAAKALKGIVNVAAVDCDEHKSVAGEHSIRGFPTIKFFYVSDGKIKSSDYSGGRSAKEIVAFAMDKAKAYAFKQLGEKPPSGGSSGGGRASGGGAGAGAGGDDFYGGTDVVTLNDANFDEEVLQSDDIWFVEVRTDSAVTVVCGVSCSVASGPVSRLQLHMSCKQEGLGSSAQCWWRPMLCAWLRLALMSSCSMGTRGALGQLEPYGTLSPFRSSLAKRSWFRQAKATMCFSALLHYAAA